MKVKFCSLTGEVITPNDIEYDKLRQEWNRAIQRYPIAIIYCYNNCDVSNAIIWARFNIIPIRIRSGGHNYQGFSTGNAVLVIDISNLDYFKINEDMNYIKVGGGIKNKKLYAELTSRGYPFPGGTCPTVGVSGFVTGGGWGLSCRKFGLGCDSLLEIEMINYKGKLIKANNFKNTDLFWAIKGSGGGNYGVIVSMTFSLPKQKVNNISLFTLYYPNASLTTQFDFFNTWQNWIVNANKNINMRAGIYNSASDGIYSYALGLSYLDKDTTSKNLTPFLNIPGCIFNIEYIPLQDAINKLQSTYPPYEYFKSASRFSYKYYDSNSIYELLKIINNNRPKGSYLTALNMYGLGGKVSDICSNETAFYYRNANYILYIQTVFENNNYLNINTEWVNTHYHYLSSLTCGNYINFPYYPLKNYEYEYYGNNISRINKVKEKYDPYCIFTFPQGVGYQRFCNTSSLCKLNLSTRF